MLEQLTDEQINNKIRDFVNDGFTSAQDLISLLKARSDGLPSYAGLSGTLKEDPHLFSDADLREIIEHVATLLPKKLREMKSSCYTRGLESLAGFANDILLERAGITAENFLAGTLPTVVK